MLFNGVLHIKRIETLIHAFTSFDILVYEIFKSKEGMCLHEKRWICPICKDGITYSIVEGLSPPQKLNFYDYIYVASYIYSSTLREGAFVDQQNTMFKW